MEKDKTANTSAQRSSGGGHRNTSAKRMPARNKTFQYPKFGARKKPRVPEAQLHAERNREKPNTGVPKIEPGILRVIPIGGVEQIGQNMTALEYGNDIIIVDAGIQFAESNHPGIDYIIPNTKYLVENREKIRGIFITHGHLDHIGAIPYIIEGIGNPPIYSREFGAVMIRKRHEEFPHLPALNIHIVEEKEVIRINDTFVIRTFPISHTIPDSMGLIIETAFGEIAFIEDVRVDNIGGIPSEEEVEQYKQFKDRKMLMLTMDSTSIWKAGWSLSESTVAENIKKIMQGVSGRLIIATFASQIERLVVIIDAAEKMGKKILIDGRSMKTNLEISKQLGILDAQNIIGIEDAHKYPAHKTVIVVTGGQGEEFSTLSRMANLTHRQLRLEPSDTVLLSASVIPGNEGDIDKLKDNLYRSGAKIISYTDSDVHASGHGNREELGWIHRQFNYRFFMPVHGNHWMLCQHAEMSQTLGTPKERTIVPDNGSIIEFYRDEKDEKTLENVKFRVRKEKAPSELVMVDGFAVGDTQEFVIRDRKMLAQDGIFTIVALVDSRTGKLRKSPDLISRGFVYLKENQELLHEARSLTRKAIEDRTVGQAGVDFDFIKGEVGDTVSKFLFQKTAKRPLVIPVILTV